MQICLGDFLFYAMKSILLFFLIFLTCNLSFAKKGEVRINLTDDFQEMYIANVQIFDESNNLIGKTDNGGDYYLESPKTPIKIRFSKVNYLDTVITINSKSNSIFVKMKLLPDVIIKLNGVIRDEACISEMLKIKNDSSVVDPYYGSPGKETLFNYLSKELIYPLFAIEHGIEGKVYVTFIVEADGTVSCASILKGVSYCLDIEAIRIVKAMSKWIPAQKNGVSVRSVCNLPLNFKLQ